MSDMLFVELARLCPQQESMTTAPRCHFLDLGRLCPQKESQCVHTSEFWNCLWVPNVQQMPIAYGGASLQQVQHDFAFVCAIEKQCLHRTCMPLLRAFCFFFILAQLVRSVHVEVSMLPGPFNACPCHPLCHSLFVQVVS